MSLSLERSSCCFIAPSTSQVHTITFPWYLTIYSYSIHWLEGGLCVGYSNEGAGVCRVDPQAGEPGPCVHSSRAGGARAWERKTHLHRPCSPALFRRWHHRCEDDTLATCAGAKSQNLSARRGNLFVWGVFDRATDPADRTRSIKKGKGICADRATRSTRRRDALAESSRLGSDSCKSRQTKS